MRQIQYIREDFKGSKRFFIVQFLLVLTSFILIGFCITKYVTFLFTLHMAEDLLQLNHTYIMKDLTDVEKSFAITSDESNLSRLKELYAMIEAQEHYKIYYAGGIELSDDVQVSLVEADEGGMRLFGFTKEYERLQSEKDCGYVPVMAGSDLKAWVDIGDVILDEYMVVGFLDKNACYIQPSYTSSIEKLNRSILYCPQISESDQLNVWESAITQTCIITDDPAVLETIAKCSHDLDLFEIRYISLSRQMKLAFRQEMILVRYALLFIIISVVLSIICMITALLVFVDKHTKELAVHVMCGACMRDICMRITAQAGMGYVIAWVITSLIYRDYVVSLTLLAICLMLSIIVSAVPVIKIRRQGLADLLKRSE